jgi:hypothetical protein
LDSWHSIGSVCKLPVFFRKPKSNEIVIRFETSIAHNVPKDNNIKRGDEDKDNWERFDFYTAKTFPLKADTESATRISKV